MLQDILNCAPFRLASPRPLTQYEWTVVENAVRAGLMLRSGLPSDAVEYDARALTTAISRQVACPAWTTSEFGPPPAVSRYAYTCLGNWFGSLDASSKGRVIQDIGTGLLCSSFRPWEGLCALSRLETPRNLWEGSEQRGAMFPGADACIVNRVRTMYAPMTGAEIVELGKRLMWGNIPQLLEQASQLPGFMQRSFLIGIQAREPSGGLLATLGSGNVFAAMDALVEDLALIWAPGRGISLKAGIMSGHLDVNALMTAMADVLPSMVNDWMQNLPGLLGNVLPGLLPGGLFPQVQQRFVGSSGAAPRTLLMGLDITDQVGDQLPPEDPLQDLTPGSARRLGSALALDAAYYLMPAAALVGGVALGFGAAWGFMRR